MTVDDDAVHGVYAGELRYPAEMAPEVIARYAAWIATLPAAMTSAVVVDRLDSRAHAGVMVRGCFAGPPAEGRALVDAWRRWARPWLDRFATLPPGEIAGLFDEPLAAEAAVLTVWLRALPDDVIDVICAATLRPGDPPGLRAELRPAVGLVRLRVVAAIGSAGGATAAGARLAALRTALAATGFTTAAPL